MVNINKFVVGKEDKPIEPTLEELEACIKMEGKMNKKTTSEDNKIKYLVAMKKSKTIWEFPTKEERAGFIKKFKDEEYATSEIEDEKNK